MVGGDYEWTKEVVIVKRFCVEGDCVMCDG